MRVPRRPQALAAVATAPLVALSVAACTPSVAPRALDPAAPSEQPAAQSAPQSEPAGQDAPQSTDEATNASQAAPVPTPADVASRFAGARATQWGTDVSGVHVRLHPSEAPRVALTLDACGGPGGSAYDAQLIDGLRSRGTPATLFLNSRWIDANPELAAELAADPLFELANHGTEHRPLSTTGQEAYGIGGTGSPAEAAQEVYGNHLRLTELTGQPPRFFRSGTAHYDEVAVQIANAYEESVVGFTVNADGGATYDAATVQAEVSSTQPGAVIIAHMNQPAGATAEGLLAGIDELSARGYQFTLLDDLE